MESPQKDAHLKAILNTPAGCGPSVSAPKWNLPTNTTTETFLITDTLVSTSSGVNDPVTASIAVTFQNCVATVDLQCILDLVRINVRTRNAEYNPARFNGVVMRILEPRSTALIFRSGKIVCTGARTEHDALIATKKFARIIQRQGFDIKFSNFKIQNIVATCDLRFPIKLDNLINKHGQFCRYEPELFPALVYRLIKPRLVMLIFVNGKIVFTGAKSRQDINDALDNMYFVLLSFKKN